MKPKENKSSGLNISIIKAETAKLFKPVEGSKNDRAIVHTDNIIKARTAEGGAPVIMTYRTKGGIRK